MITIVVYFHKKYYRGFKSYYMEHVWMSWLTNFLTC